MVSYPPAPVPRLRRRMRRPLRRRGCLLAGCLAALAAPALCGCLLLAAYVLFPPEPVDVLLLGVDARPGQGYLTRTDSVMVLNITPGRASVSLLSIPRDVFIHVPGYGEQRINTINVLGEQDGYGGPALLTASMAESFGIEVDHYARLDFAAFTALVDAVGGVEIDVPKRIVDYEYPTPEGGVMTVVFEPGRQHMNGERALQYARTRHQDDDFRRAERQQQVIDALVRKLVTAPQHWGQVMALLGDWDTDLSTWDMLRLSPGLLVGWSGRDQRVLEREDLIGMRAGYWVPNYERLLPWIAEHFD